MIFTAKKANIKLVEKIQAAAQRCDKNRALKSSPQTEGRNIMEKTLKIISGAVCAVLVFAALLISFYHAALPVNISTDINGNVSGGFSLAVLRPTNGGAGYYVGAIPIKNAETDKMERPSVIPCGTPFGIKLRADGVMVISVSRGSPAEKCGLKSGDVITSVNRTPVYTNTDIENALRLSPESAVITIKRGDSEISLSAVPEERDEYLRIGAWVRDSAAGIGTLTFCCPENGVFGGLGHAVSDVTTKQAIPLRTGEITDADIYGISKGEKGSAGELCGALLPGSAGTLLANTSVGVFGTLDTLPEAQSIPVAFRQEVHSGAASILTTISGGTPQEYSIEIERVNLFDITGSKSMVIRITDKRLLDETGGIVRGMSGSPIIQDGMLVGAVTHVLVNDPERGYAVFAESMLEELGQSGVTSVSSENAA